LRALTISSHGGLDALEYRTDLPIPDVSAGQVRVRVSAAALNHLDLFMLDGLPGVTLRPPWVLGADGTGTIDAIGENAKTHLMIGDRVVINGGISDGTCEFCKAGEQSLCVKFRLLGEHQRPRLHIVQHERSQHDRRPRAARNTQREHGYQRGAGRRIFRCFRRGKPICNTGAELAAAAIHLFLDSVSDERSDGRAAAGDRTDRTADARAA